MKMDNEPGVFTGSEAIKLLKDALEELETAQIYVAVDMSDIIDKIRAYLDAKGKICNICGAPADNYACNACRAEFQDEKED